MYGSVKNDLILAPESRKCTLRGSDFKSFPRKITLDLPRRSSNPFAAYFYILPPTLILIDNPVKEPFVL